MDIILEAINMHTIIPVSKKSFVPSKGLGGSRGPTKEEWMEYIVMEDRTEKFRGYWSGMSKWGGRKEDMCNRGNIESRR